MSKAMSNLRKLTGAVEVGAYDPIAPENCMRSSSPSLNWSFGHKGHGLPFGYGMLLYGPPKGGKSVICNDFIGQLHMSDPKAITVTFNTELRGELQANAEQMKLWGIDPKRHITYDVNEAALIFDRITIDIVAAIQEGEKIRCIVIDSLTNIVGRRTLNSDTVNQQQIGDHAATIKDGLARILPVCRQYKIALIATTHVRAELDMAQQMRGKTIKMQAAWATKHMFEFFAYVERNETKAGRTALDGSSFTNSEVKDFADKEEITGQKIRFRIDDSSIGTRGRNAEFTMDFQKGMINRHEEILLIATAVGIIKRPNNVMYQYGKDSWRGVKECLNALRMDTTLAANILNDSMNTDSKKLENKEEDIVQPKEQ